VTPTAVVLLMAAAGLHAGWNLLGKRQAATAAFMLTANALGCLCLLPALVLYSHTLAMFAPEVWGYLALTGLCQAAYYAPWPARTGPATSTIAYPVARSSPAVIVTVVAVMLGAASR